MAALKLTWIMAMVITWNASSNAISLKNLKMNDLSGYDELKRMGKMERGENPLGNGFTSTCRVKVLSVDHTSGFVGQYFNFNKCSIYGLQNGGSMTINAKNSRTGQTGEVIVWGSANGGSVGDSHGRFNYNPVAPNIKQWKVGDDVILLNQAHCGKCCEVEVLSVDHSFGIVGQYFNFNKCAILGLQNAGTMTMNAMNSRTGQTGQIVVWGSPNGGSIGDSHGRFDNNPVSPQKDQWEVGDKVILLNQVQCGECPACRVKVLSVDHTFGIVGQYFNFNKCSIRGLQNGGELTMKARNSRTGQTGEIIVWGQTNGGSIGDSHGRFNSNPVAPNKEQWKVGDEIILFNEAYCGKCCEVGVLGVDHSSGIIGQYFNFYKCAIHGLQNAGTMTLNAMNSRSGQTGQIIVWGSTNGGSIGDSHGRFNYNPVSPKKGQWLVGDKIILLSQKHCGKCQ